jgi:hypothetical protein
MKKIEYLGHTFFSNGKVFKNTIQINPKEEIYKEILLNSKHIILI